MKKVTLFAALLLATAALPAPTTAQLPGIGVRLVPKAGMYRPLGDLAEGFRAENHWAVGVAAELDLPFLPIDIRANVDFTPKNDIVTDSGVRAGTASIMNLAGDVLLRPLPGIIPVQPYLFVGGGVKKYRFNDFTSGVFGSGDNRSEPTLHAGAGVGFGIGPLGVMIEGGDYVSRFEHAGDSKLQNDLYGMVGLRLGIL
jgi:hypothetical protein